MINLLPPDYKKNLFYSRRNRSLFKWATALGVSLVFSFLIILIGWVYLDQSIKKQAKSAELIENTLKDQKIDETTAKIDEISKNTKLVLQVLQKEVLFSKLLTQLGSSLPPDTALESINIIELKGGITIRALAKDIKSGSQIQLNLSDPKNKIFKQADIESINCDNGLNIAGEKPIYPCTVQLKALFADNNEYVYIGANQ